MRRHTSLLAGIAVIAAIGLYTLAPILPAAAQSAPGQKASLSATFIVENMTCALCPITVRKAMQGVDGVRSVVIDLEAKTALVTFDPAVASIAEIAAASTDAGYPARPGS